MAPEMLRGEVYDEKVDIFSFGIVLCEVGHHSLMYTYNEFEGPYFQLFNHRSYRLRNRDWKLLTLAIESTGAIRVARKTTKMRKNCKKMAKNHTFF